MKFIFLFVICILQISKPHRTTPLGTCSFPFLYESSLNYDCLYEAESNQEWCLIDSSLDSGSLPASSTKMKKAYCSEEEENNHFFLKTLQADFQTYFCLAFIDDKSDSLHLQDNNLNFERSNSQEKSRTNDDRLEIKNKDLSSKFIANENHIKKVDDHNGHSNYDDSHEDDNYISFVPCVNDKIPIKNLVWKWDNDGEILKDKQTVLCEKKNMIGLCKRKTQKNKWMIDENGRMLNLNSGKCLNQIFLHNEKRINLVDCLDQV